MGDRRSVWVLAICCALVFACASCRAPGSEELREVLVYVRNDMSTPVIIELRAHNLRDNYEVPPLVRASLVWWPGESLTARVFRADCSALGTVGLTVERSIIFVKSDGQLHVSYYGDVAYVHPTPYMTELSWLAMEPEGGCSGD